MATAPRTAPCPPSTSARQSRGVPRAAAAPAASRPRAPAADARGAHNSKPGKQPNSNDKAKTVKRESGIDVDDLDEFDIEEASEAISAKPKAVKRGGSGSAGGPGTPGGKAAPFSWTPRMQGAAKLQTGKPSCDEAFEMSLIKPTWEAGDVVEVAWKGKGFEGSWAEADVVRVEGTKHALVRFREFVDTDGTPLVEKTPNERLRLPPPSAPVGWHPVLGERIEGEWNDCWWEGVVREFHPLKGVLFQYDRYANWMWLPLHATRPRPPPYLFYPQRDELPEPEVEESSGPRAGICGLQGCQLPNNHLGLCQIRVEGTRRSSMKEKAELQNQEQLWQEIKSRKETRDHVDQARADALKRTEQVRSATAPVPPPAPLPSLPPPVLTAALPYPLLAGGGGDQGAAGQQVAVAQGIPARRIHGRDAHRQRAPRGGGRWGAAAPGHARARAGAHARRRVPHATHRAAGARSPSHRTPLRPLHTSDPTS